MTVRFTLRARDDLRAILGYLTAESPAAAERVRQAMVNTIRSIAERPHLGIRNAKAPELRSRLVGRYPYRIHDLVEAADLWIIHIRHSARRPFDVEAPD
ncbi:MAG: type II toxin-antitoxin system RelE/ParE family toxin [Rhodopseudomonas palustris]|uniref:Type II toxin-antitoxin system RelE/ParE family toxin n=1 Tax=Rhodopseudomonas palustris TaxID=1076 RepID=A0A933RZH1_RHOPL|nr:type II toxin-antitoxin system RelE/ParE family toxin [Rhodopseudomonas palustris]